MQAQTTTIDGQTIQTKNPGIAAVRAKAGDTTQINNSQVTTRGTGAIALAAIGVLTGKALIVQTDGQNAQAAEARDGGTIDLEQTHITTNGIGAVGLQASESHSLVRMSGGSIATNGRSAYGLYSENDGRVQVENVSVSTDQESAYGATVQSGGSVQLLASTLATRGKEAHGVLLMGGSKTDLALATIRNSQLATRGDFAVGVNVNFDASATLEHSQITTRGEYADAIWLANPGTNAVVSNVLIATNGDNAKGISSQGGTATLQDVTITTQGSQAHGLYSEGASARLDGKAISITIDQPGAGAFAVNSGTITLDGGTVTGHNGGNGLLAASKAKLTASHLQVQVDGNAASALIVTDGATLTLADTQASATGTGSTGLWAGASTATAGNQVSLKDTRLTALQGTAIAVRGGRLDLSLDNAYVEGQHLLNVGADPLTNARAPQGQVQIEARHSSLLGDIQVTGASAGPATLQLRESTLTGAVQGLDRLEVLDASRWTLTASSTLGELNNQASVVFQPGGAFKTLTIEGDLTGTGRFSLNTDLATQHGDLLRVLGTLSGNHTLFVADSGHEPSAANGELRLVDGAGGSGSFSLGGRPYVDAGAFRYSLQQQGDDWFLRNTGAADVPAQNLSDGANAALGTQTAAATLWSAEMNALVKRLGELRMGHDNGGIWSRVLGKTYQVESAHVRRFEQAVHGTEIGADTAIPVSTGKVYVGGMLGAATSTQHYGNGSRGEIDSQMLGAYATWLNDTGYYLDNVIKYNRMKNRVSNQANTGELIKGRYNTLGYAADVELGRHIRFGDGWFVEPQGELTYTHTAGARYTTSNGLNVDAGDTHSLQGRLGTLFGRAWSLRNGMAAQPYVKASYVHEFAGTSRVKVNGHSLANRMASSRAEYGLGGVLQVSEKTKLSLDIQQSKGNQVDEPWAINLGLRYLW